MARIDWVKQRLERWGAWCGQRVQGASGYPKASSFLRVGGRGTANTSVMNRFEEEASETNNAVEALRASRPHLVETLRLIYVKGVGVKEAARQTHLAEPTIKAHLEQSDHAVAAWLTDNKGLDVQTPAHN
jgi:predicted DNA-binding protein (UPF0251 family)